MHDSSALLDITLLMLRLVVLVSLPPVLTAALIGLFIGILQAVTQLQDQSLPFAIKFLGVAFVITLTLPWLGSSFNNFMSQIFNAIVRLG